MKTVELVKPNLCDLWFRQAMLCDPETMSYNAGYEVSYLGYHYNTGCIDFKKENWESWFNTKLKNPNFYYAYILDVETKKFVGQVNFTLDPSSRSAAMGIVIKHEFSGQGYMRPAMQQLIAQAKNMGVKTLTDDVPKNRERALKVFFSMGFESDGTFETKKFNKPETVIKLKLEL